MRQQENICSYVLLSCFYLFETVEPVRDVRLEKEIIIREAQDLAKTGHIDQPIDTDAAELLAVTYHELREGVTSEGTKHEK